MYTAIGLDHHMYLLSGGHEGDLQAVQPMRIWLARQERDLLIEVECLREPDQPPTLHIGLHQVKAKAGQRVQDGTLSWHGIDLDRIVVAAVDRSCQLQLC